MNKLIQHGLALILIGISLTPAATAQQALPDFKPNHIPRTAELLKAARTASVYHPTETIHLTMVDLNWINETRTRNVYEGGLLREQYQDIWEGEVFGEWKEQNVTSYQYANGTLSEVWTYEIVNGNMIARTRTLYTSQNGVYTEILSQVIENSTWVNDERTSFTLSDGQIVSGLTETWDVQWVPSERFTLVEDDGDVVETYQMHDGTTWVNSERYTYEDLTIAQLFEYLERLLNDFTDYEGLYFGLRFPDAVEQQWNGSEWVNVTRQQTETFYDVWVGYLAKQIVTTDEWTDGAWVPSLQVTFDYTNHTEYPGFEGQPAKTTFQVHDGSDWVTLFVEKYILQSDIRRIVQATVEADLGEGLQDVSQMRITWADVASDTQDNETPRSFELNGNYPNPFNPSTLISFHLHEAQQVRLAIFDLLGREVAVLGDGFRAAGEHKVSWDASSMPSGVYLYRIEAGTHSQTRQMILVK